MWALLFSAALVFTVVQSAGGSGARGDLSDADAGSDDEFGIILD